MLQRFSEGEAVGTVDMEEDIIVRIRGVRGEENVGGEKSENTRKIQDYIGKKYPQPMGTMSQINKAHQNITVRATLP